MNTFLKLTYLCFLGLVVFASCKPQKMKNQGIHGNVYWIEGNQMPQASQDEASSLSPAAQNPVKRTIHIHQLTHINQASLGDYLFGSIETPLVASIETNDEGEFSVELPPGKYSIFTVEENGYFASIFDLDSYIHPVHVEKGEWSKVAITINYKATF
ncbi:carboxypeptidase regulatory-like domain-containing protein [Cyclobacterium sp. 1_MG-2023]|nr:carboxypeptidase regulatory-like domain-containing protein [Cyclobacterium sp. 1_MG-2023]